MRTKLPLADMGIVSVMNFDVLQHGPPPIDFSKDIPAGAAPKEEPSITYKEPDLHGKGTFWGALPSSAPSCGGPA